MSSTESGLDPSLARKLLYGGPVVYLGVYVVAALAIPPDPVLQSATVGMGLVTAPLVFLVLRETLPAVGEVG